jgi:anion-transporting  ArsA/GET3 family ATPase
MPAEPELSILKRRLVIVTGKGGTGKTTVAATLALAAARAGLRVLVAEVGHHEHLPRLLLPDCPEVGYAGMELQPRLRAVHIDPFEALAEYLGLQLRIRAPVDAVLSNKSFRQLMQAAPGWRELIALGKIWHFEQMRDADDELLYDLIVVDAPATGHGMTFLDVPRVVSSAVRAGPLRSNAELVENMIHDRSRTLLLPVALAEELPTQETAELVDRVRQEIGISLDRVVVNSMAPAPFPPGLEDLSERLDALEPGVPLGALPPTHVLASCASYMQSRYELNRDYLQEIAHRTQLPVVPLPYLARGVCGPDDLAELAVYLLAEPGPGDDAPPWAHWSARGAADGASP